MNEAMRDWVTNVDDTHYIIGSVAGPHPYPMLVRDFQRVIGDETKAQCRQAEGRLPDLPGGMRWRRLQRDGLVLSLRRRRRRGHGGRGSRWREPGERSPRRAIECRAIRGVLHGSHTLHHGRQRRSDPARRTPCRPAWTIPASVPNTALAALRLLTRTEGILPALESSHAVAWAVAEAARRPASDVIVVNLSGRGDKDIDTVASIDRIEL